jgi:hypothetical protein
MREEEIMQGSKGLILATALALVGTCAFSASPAEARGVVTIYATSEPPPLREELIPAPRRGYVWVPGSWNWSHRRYAWSRGHFVRERRGYHYTPARWDHDGNRWRYNAGRWDH